MNIELQTVLANARAADDLGARSAVRQISDANRFAERPETLTNDARLRDGADTTVVPAVIPLIVALVVAPVAVVLRIVALRRSEGRRKSESY